jgi:hypothetical protein
MTQTELENKGMKDVKENCYEINSLLHKNEKEILLQETIGELRANIIRREKCVQKIIAES